MSTKTNFKRIALVAVAALGLGVLSSVPSQALLGAAPTVTVTDGTAGLAGVRTDSTNAARITVTGLLDQASGDADSITVSVIERTIGTGITPKVGIQFIESGTSTIGNSTAVDTISAQSAVRSSARSLLVGPQTTDTVSSTGSGVFRITSGTGTKNVSATFGLQMDSATSTRVAGTAGYTVLVRYIDLNGVTQTISRDVNIVIAAAASASATATATYGFANLSETTIADGTAQAVDAVINASATSGTTRGYLFVAVRNAANGFATATDSLTATVTGVGLVCSEAGTCGKSLSKIAVTGDYQFTLQGDGNGGTSTVVVTSGVTGVSYSKQLTYFATAAKTLTATVLTPVLKIGANDSAVAVAAVDAAGAVWGGAAYIVASAAADATAVGGSATTPVACVFRSSNGTHYCPISAVAAGTGKFKVIDAATVALATATSNEVTVKSSAQLAATVKISFNKANYAPGETGMIMITPLDAAGAAMPAGSVTTGALASGGITSDVGLSYNSAAVTLTGTDITTAAYTGSTTVAGSQVIFFNAPVGGGKITLTAKGGTGLPLAGQVALTATATVTDNGAAALAAVNALATTVASLKTLITTLTNLVLKIQKKVKA